MFTLFTFIHPLILPSLQTQDINNPQFRLLTRVKFWHFVGTEEEAVQKEIHEKRLESLRKELVGLKNTEWQYDPITKHIGQS